MQGIPEAVWLDMPHVLKENADWCWLGVAEMAVRYRNSSQSPRQCHMLEMVFEYGNGVCRVSPGARGRGGTLEKTGTVVLSLGGGTASHTGPLEPVDVPYGVFRPLRTETLIIG